MLKCCNTAVTSDSQEILNTILTNRKKCFPHQGLLNSWQCLLLPKTGRRKGFFWKRVNSIPSWLFSNLSNMHASLTTLSFCFISHSIAQSSFLSNLRNIINYNLLFCNMEWRQLHIQTQLLLSKINKIIRDTYFPIVSCSHIPLAHSIPIISIWIWCVPNSFLCKNQPRTNFNQSIWIIIPFCILIPYFFNNLLSVSHYKWWDV